MMKRRRLVITGVLLLLGGAIVNVAVAWGCSMYVKRPEIPLHMRSHLVSGLFSCKNGSPPTLWVVHVVNAPTHKRWILRGVSQEYDSRGTLVYWTGSGWSEAITLPEFVPQQYELTWYFSGWPLRSMQGGEWFIQNYATVDSSPRYVLQMGVWFGNNKPAKGVKVEDCVFLPFAPIWPGFAINTIFYAAMLWVVFFVPGMVRRRIRRRRGLCPACAYPIGTSPVCTECGNPLKIRTGMGLPPPATPATDRERTT